MSDAPAPGPDSDRRLRFRSREDHAISLFEEASAHLHDVGRVRRILLELGRFYNPYVDQPIVDATTCRRIVTLIEEGQVEEAGRLLDERRALYARPDPPGDG